MSVSKPKKLLMVGSGSTENLLKRFRRALINSAKTPYKLVTKRDTLLLDDNILYTGDHSSCIEATGKTFALVTSFTCEMLLVHEDLMLIGEVNFILLIFFFIFTSIVVNINTALHLILTAEFLWVTLYVLVVLVGLLYDNVNLLSLTFFFLILSAVEFGVGLVIILLQNIFTRSINLNEGNTNHFKFTLRFVNQLVLNRFKHL